MSNENDKPQASEPAAPEAKPTPKVTLGGNRSKVIELAYPATYEGVTYDKVTVTRPNQAQVAEFVDAIAAGAPIAMDLYDVPFDIAELDPDDFEVINKVTFDFLPRSLQTVLRQNPENTGDTPPSSQASSEAGSSNTSA